MEIKNVGKNIEKSFRIFSFIHDSVFPMVADERRDLTEGNSSLCIVRSLVSASCGIVTGLDVRRGQCGQLDTPYLGVVC